MTDKDRQRVETFVKSCEYTTEEIESWVASMALNAARGGGGAGAGMASSPMPSSSSFLSSSPSPTGTTSSSSRGGGGGKMLPKLHTINLDQWAELCSQFWRATNDVGCRLYQRYDKMEASFLVYVFSSLCGFIVRYLNAASTEEEWLYRGHQLVTKRCFYMFACFMEPRRAGEMMMGHPDANLAVTFHKKMVAVCRETVDTSTEESAMNGGAFSAMTQLYIVLSNAFRDRNDLRIAAGLALNLNQPIPASYGGGYGNNTHSSMSGSNPLSSWGGGGTEPPSSASAILSTAVLPPPAAVLPAASPFATTPPQVLTLLERTLETIRFLCESGVPTATEAARLLYAAKLECKMRTRMEPKGVHMAVMKCAAEAAVHTAEGVSIIGKALLDNLQAVAVATPLGELWDATEGERREIEKYHARVAAAAAAEAANAGDAAPTPSALLEYGESPAAPFTSTNVSAAINGSFNARQSSTIVGGGAGGDLASSSLYNSPTRGIGAGGAGAGGCATTTSNGVPFMYNPNGSVTYRTIPSLVRSTDNALYNDFPTPAHEHYYIATMTLVCIVKVLAEAIADADDLAVTIAALEVFCGESDDYAPVTAPSAVVPPNTAVSMAPTTAGGGGAPTSFVPMGNQPTFPSVLPNVNTFSSFSSNAPLGINGGSMGLSPGVGGSSSSPSTTAPPPPPTAVKASFLQLLALLVRTSGFSLTHKTFFGPLLRRSEAIKHHQHQYSSAAFTHQSMSGQSAAEGTAQHAGDFGVSNASFGLASMQGGLGGINHSSNSNQQQQQQDASMLMSPTHLNTTLLSTTAAGGLLAAGGNTSLRTPAPPINVVSCVTGDIPNIVSFTPMSPLLQNGAHNTASSITGAVGMAGMSGGLSMNVPAAAAGSANIAGADIGSILGSMNPSSNGAPTAATGADASQRKDGNANNANTNTTADTTHSNATGGGSPNDPSNANAANGGSSGGGEITDDLDLLGAVFIRLSDIHEDLHTTITRAFFRLLNNSRLEPSVRIALLDVFRKAQNACKVPWGTDERRLEALRLITDLLMLEDWGSDHHGGKENAENASSAAAPTPSTITMMMAGQQQSGLNNGSVLSPLAGKSRAGAASADAIAINDGEGDDEYRIVSSIRHPDGSSTLLHHDLSHPNASSANGGRVIGTADSLTTASPLLAHSGSTNRHSLRGNRSLSASRGLTADGGGGTSPRLRSSCSSPLLLSRSARRRAKRNASFSVAALAATDRGSGSYGGADETTAAAPAPPPIPKPKDPVPTISLDDKERIRIIGINIIEDIVRLIPAPEKALLCVAKMLRSRMRATTAVRVFTVLSNILIRGTTETAPSSVATVSGAVISEPASSAVTAAAAAADGAPTTVTTADGFVLVNGTSTASLRSDSTLLQQQQSGGGPAPPAASPSFVKGSTSAPAATTSIGGGGSTGGGLSHDTIAILHDTMSFVVKRLVTEGREGFFVPASRTALELDGAHSPVRRHAHSPRGHHHHHHLPHHAEGGATVRKSARLGLEDGEEALLLPPSHLQQQQQQSEGVSTTSSTGLLGTDVMFSSGLPSTSSHTTAMHHGTGSAANGAAASGSASSHTTVYSPNSYGSPMLSPNSPTQAQTVAAEDAAIRAVGHFIDILLRRCDSRIDPENHLHVMELLRSGDAVIRDFAESIIKSAIVGDKYPSNLPATGTGAPAVVAGGRPPMAPSSVAPSVVSSPTGPSAAAVAAVRSSTATGSDTEGSFASSSRVLPHPPTPTAKGTPATLSMPTPLTAAAGLVPSTPSTAPTTIMAVPSAVGAVSTAPSSSSYRPNARDGISVYLSMMGEFPEVIDILVRILTTSSKEASAAIVARFGAAGGVDKLLAHIEAALGATRTRMVERTVAPPPSAAQTTTTVGLPPLSQKTLAASAAVAVKKTHVVVAAFAHDSSSSEPPSFNNAHHQHHPHPQHRTTFNLDGIDAVEVMESEMGSSAPTDDVGGGGGASSSAGPHMISSMMSSSCATPVGSPLVALNASASGGASSGKRSAYSAGHNKREASATDSLTAARVSVAIEMPVPVPPSQVRSWFMLLALLENGELLQSFRAYERLEAAIGKAGQWYTRIKAKLASEAKRRGDVERREADRRRVIAEHEGAAAEQVYDACEAMWLELWRSSEDNTPNNAHSSDDDTTTVSATTAPGTRTASMSRVGWAEASGAPPSGRDPFGGTYNGGLDSTQTTLAMPEGGGGGGGHHFRTNSAFIPEVPLTARPNYTFGSRGGSQQHSRSQSYGAETNDTSNGGDTPPPPRFRDARRATEAPVTMAADLARLLSGPHHSSDEGIDDGVAAESSSSSSSGDDNNSLRDLSQRRRSSGGGGSSGNNSDSSGGSSNDSEASTLLAAGDSGYDVSFHAPAKKVPALSLKMALANKKNQRSTGKGKKKSGTKSVDTPSMEGADRGGGSSCASSIKVPRLSLNFGAVPLAAAATASGDANADAPIRQSFGDVDSDDNAPPPPPPPANLRDDTDNDEYDDGGRRPTPPPIAHSSSFRFGSSGVLKSHHSASSFGSSPPGTRKGDAKDILDEMTDLLSTDTPPRLLEKKPSSASSHGAGGGGTSPTPSLSPPSPPVGIYRQSSMGSGGARSGADDASSGNGMGERRRSNATNHHARFADDVVEPAGGGPSTPPRGSPPSRRSIAAQQGGDSPPPHLRLQQEQQRPSSGSNKATSASVSQPRGSFLFSPNNNNNGLLSPNGHVGGSMVDLVDDRPMVSAELLIGSANDSFIERMLADNVVQPTSAMPSKQNSSNEVDGLLEEGQRITAADGAGMMMAGDANGKSGHRHSHSHHSRRVAGEHRHYEHQKESYEGLIGEDGESPSHGFYGNATTGSASEKGDHDDDSDDADSDGSVVYRPKGGASPHHRDDRPSAAAPSATTALFQTGISGNAANGTVGDGDHDDDDADERLRIFSNFNNTMDASRIDRGALSGDHNNLVDDDADGVASDVADEDDGDDGYDDDDGSSYSNDSGDSYDSDAMADEWVVVEETSAEEDAFAALKELLETIAQCVLDSATGSNLAVARAQAQLHLKAQAQLLQLTASGGGAVNASANNISTTLSSTAGSVGMSLALAPPQLSTALSTASLGIGASAVITPTMAAGGTSGGSSVAAHRRVFGDFSLSVPFAPVKPSFLNLIPSLHDAIEGSSGFVEAVVAVISAGRCLDSNILVDYALAKDMPELLNSIQIPADRIYSLPMDQYNPHKVLTFWDPLITNGPVRSEVRYRGNGGIVVNTTIQSFFAMAPQAHIMGDASLLGSTATATSTTSAAAASGGAAGTGGNAGGTVSANPLVRHADPMGALGSTVADMSKFGMTPLGASLPMGNGAPLPSVLADTTTAAPSAGTKKGTAAADGGNSAAANNGGSRKDAISINLNEFTGFTIGFWYLVSAAEREEVVIEEGVGGAQLGSGFGPSPSVLPHLAPSPLSTMTPALASAAGGAFADALNVAGAASDNTMSNPYVSPDTVAGSSGGTTAGSPAGLPSVLGAAAGGGPASPQQPTASPVSASTMTIASMSLGATAAVSATTTAVLVSPASTAAPPSPKKRKVYEMPSVIPLLELKLSNGTRFTMTIRDTDRIEAVLSQDGEGIASTSTAGATGATNTTNSTATAATAAAKKLMTRTVNEDQPLHCVSSNAWVYFAFVCAPKNETSADSYVMSVFAQGKMVGSVPIATQQMAVTNPPFVCGQRLTAVIGPAAVATTAAAGASAAGGGVGGTAASSSAVGSRGVTRIDDCLYSIGEVSVWNEALGQKNLHGAMFGQTLEPNPRKRRPHEAFAVLDEALPAPTLSLSGRFVPHMSAARQVNVTSHQLKNIALYGSTAAPAAATTAAITGQHFPAPKAFVEPRMLFVRLGGMRFLSQWMLKGAEAAGKKRLGGGGGGFFGFGNTNSNIAAAAPSSSSSADAATAASSLLLVDEALLKSAFRIFIEVTRNVTYVETLRPRMYCQLALVLKKLGRRFDRDMGRMLLRLAAEPIRISSDKDKNRKRKKAYVIINKHAVEYVLADVQVYENMEPEVAVEILSTVEAFFNSKDPELAPYAVINSESVMGQRFTDRLLQGCIFASEALPIRVMNAVIGVFKASVTSRGFPLPLIQSIVVACAQIMMSESTYATTTTTTATTTGAMMSNNTNSATNNANANQQPSTRESGADFLDTTLRSEARLSGNVNADFPLGLAAVGGDDFGNATLRSLGSGGGNINTVSPNSFAFATNLNAITYGDSQHHQQQQNNSADDGVGGGPTRVLEESQLVLVRSLLKVLVEAVPTKGFMDSFIKTVTVTWFASLFTHLQAGDDAVLYAVELLAACLDHTPSAPAVPTGSKPAAVVAAAASAVASATAAVAAATADGAALLGAAAAAVSSKADKLSAAVSAGGSAPINALREAYDANPIVISTALERHKLSVGSLLILLAGSVGRSVTMISALHSAAAKAAAAAAAATAAEYTAAPSPTASAATAPIIGELTSTSVNETHNLAATVNVVVNDANTNANNTSTKSSLMTVTSPTTGATLNINTTIVPDASMLSLITVARGVLDDRAKWRGNKALASLFLGALLRFLEDEGVASRTAAATRAIAAATERAEQLHTAERAAQERYERELAAAKELAAEVAAAANAAANAAAAAAQSSVNHIDIASASSFMSPTPMEGSVNVNGLFNSTLVSLDADLMTAPTGVFIPPAAGSNAAGFGASSFNGGSSVNGGSEPVTAGLGNVPAGLAAAAVPIVVDFPTPPPPPQPLPATIVPTDGHKEVSVYVLGVLKEALQHCPEAVFRAFTEGKHQLNAYVRFITASDSLVSSTIAELMPPAPPIVEEPIVMLGANGSPDGPLAAAAAAIKVAGAAAPPAAAALMASPASFASGTVMSPPNGPTAATVVAVVPPPHNSGLGGLATAAQSESELSLPTAVPLRSAEDAQQQQPTLTSAAAETRLLPPMGASVLPSAAPLPLPLSGGGADALLAEEEDDDDDDGGDDCGSDAHSPLSAGDVTANANTHRGMGSRRQSQVVVFARSALDGGEIACSASPASPNKGQLQQLGDRQLSTAATADGGVGCDDGLDTAPSSGRRHNASRRATLTGSGAEFGTTPPSSFVMVGGGGDSSHRLGATPFGAGGGGGDDDSMLLDNSSPGTLNMTAVSSGGGNFNATFALGGGRGLASALEELRADQQQNGGGGSSSNPFFFADNSMGLLSVCAEVQTAALEVAKAVVKASLTLPVPADHYHHADGKHHHHHDKHHHHEGVISGAALVGKDGAGGGGGLSLGGGGIGSSAAGGATGPNAAALLVSHRLGPCGRLAFSLNTQCTNNANMLVLRFVAAVAVGTLSAHKKADDEAIMENANGLIEYFADQLIYSTRSFDLMTTEKTLDLVHLVTRRMTTLYRKKAERVRDLALRAAITVMSTRDGQGIPLLSSAPLAVWETLRYIVADCHTDDYYNVTRVSQLFYVLYKAYQQRDDQQLAACGARRLSQAIPPPSVFSPPLGASAVSKSALPPLGGTASTAVGVSNAARANASTSSRDGLGANVNTNSRPNSPVVGPHAEDVPMPSSNPLGAAVTRVPSIGGGGGGNGRVGEGGLATPLTALPPLHPTSGGGGMGSSSAAVSAMPQQPCIAGTTATNSEICTPIMAPSPPEEGTVGGGGTQSGAPFGVSSSSATNQQHQYPHAQSVSQLHQALPPVLAASPMATDPSAAATATAQFAVLGGVDSGHHVNQQQQQQPSQGLSNGSFGGLPAQSPPPAMGSSTTSQLVMETEEPRSASPTRQLGAPTPLSGFGGHSVVSDVSSHQHAGGLVGGLTNDSFGGGRQQSPRPSAVTNSVAGSPNTREPPQLLVAVTAEPPALSGPAPLPTTAPTAPSSSSEGVVGRRDSRDVGAASMLSSSPEAASQQQQQQQASSPTTTPSALMAACGFSARRQLIVHMLKTTVSAAHTVLKTHLTISGLIPGQYTSCVPSFEHLLKDDYPRFRAAMQSKEVESIINKGPPSSKIRSLEKVVEEARHRLAEEKRALIASLSTAGVLPSTAGGGVSASAAKLASAVAGGGGIKDHDLATAALALSTGSESLLAVVTRLEGIYMQQFSSVVEELEPLDVDDLIWLRMSDWVGEVNASSTAAAAAAEEAEVIADECSGGTTEGTSLGVTRNRAVSFRNLNAAVAAAEAATAARTAKRHYVDRRRNLVPFEGTGLMATDLVSGNKRGVSELQASINEEYVAHISVYVPPVLRRVPPFGTANPAWLPKDFPQRLTLSAMTLLQYILNANEKLNYITNGFKVSGIDCVPVLIVLTDCSLKLFAYSRINSNGDIFIAQRQGAAADADPLDDASTEQPSLSRQSGQLMGFSPGTSFAATQFKRFQRWVKDADKKAAIGEKVSKSVARLSSDTNRGTCWLYDLNVFSSARLCSYLHQDVAMDIGMTWDAGPMLAITDENLAMVKEARKSFAKALAKVCLRVNESFVLLDEEDVIKTQYKAWQAVWQTPWVNRSLSTYDYLTQVNAVSGRGLKDWNQYPIFPWIIKNYNADELDLTAPDTYRDLTWPIHAQTENARATAEMRYSELLADEQEPWHHATHYTSSAAVLYFMLRLQPFLTSSAAYQGGKLDHADRLFGSVGTAYKNATTNSADCKELLPEFYGNSGGSFLRNVDGVNLGMLQSGASLGDVELPPWAKGSHRVFVYLMRQALESEYVSATVHHWIDLVFGSCQVGEGAVRAFNVHKPLTYPEEVKRRLAKEDTDLGRSQILCEVQNFGQSARVVFALDHPRRLTAAEAGRGGVTRFMLESPAQYGMKEPTNLFRTPASVIQLYAAAANANAFAASATTAPTSTAAGSNRAAATGGMLSPISLASNPSVAAAATPLLSGAGTAVRKLILYEHVSSNVKGDRLSFTTDYVLPVSRTDYCICFVPDSLTFYKHSMLDGRLIETISLPTALSCKVSAVVAMNRQAAFVIATTSGQLFTVIVETVLTASYVSNFLTAHANPIVGIQACADSNTLLSYTNCADDEPAVWRYVRRYPALLCRLRFNEALSKAAAGAGGATATSGSSSRAIVKAACIDKRDTSYILASDRDIVVFDAQGVVMGVGSMPPNTEKSTFPPITSIAVLETREWVDNGTMVYVTGHEQGYLSIWRVKRRTPQTITPDRLIDVLFAHFLRPGDIAKEGGGDSPQDLAITALHVSTEGNITIGRRNGSIKTMVRPITVPAPAAAAAAAPATVASQSCAPPSLAKQQSAASAASKPAIPASALQSTPPPPTATPANNPPSSAASDAAVSNASFASQQSAMQQLAAQLQQQQQQQQSGDNSIET